MFFVFLLLFNNILSPFLCFWGCILYLNKTKDKLSLLNLNGNGKGVILYSFDDACTCLPRRAELYKSSISKCCPYFPEP